MNMQRIMRRIALAHLVAFSGFAEGSWEFLIKKYGGTNFFIDKSSVKKTDRGYSAIFLDDYTADDVFSKYYKSGKSWLEFDCGSQTFQKQKHINFSGPGASGIVVSEEQKSHIWSEIPIGSPIDAALNAVCPPYLLEWRKLMRVGYKEGNVYIKPSSLKKTENGYKVWFLVDLKKPESLNGMIHQSSKILQEFNCSEEMLRYHYRGDYSEKMGRGEPIPSANEHMNWEIVVPGSIGESMMKEICELGDSVN